MTQEVEPTKDQRSPGTVLRAAREQAGLSIEHVAEKLHLLQSIVSSLEKDCHDRIRGETFVRGYMRNYARLLGISDDDVVNRYNASKGVAGKNETRGSRKREASWHGNSGTGRVGVVLALLALGALFFVFNRDRDVATQVGVIPVVTVETATGEAIITVPDAAGPPGTSLSRR